MRISRHSIPAILLAFTVLFWLTSAPALHAARSGTSTPSLAEQILKRAASMEVELRATPFELRNADAYPKILDLYRQVLESNADREHIDEARVRMADLTREMSLRTGDAKGFIEAIDLYRTIVIARPDGPHVADALIAIAQIYQYDLQDVDGATGAYREISRRFPDSVAGREALASVARLDPLAAGTEAGTEIIGAINGTTAPLAAVPGTEKQLVNIRTYAGANYARVVLDLSAAVAYKQFREGTRVRFLLDGVRLSTALSGRRLSTPKGSILRAMSVEQLASGVAINLTLATLQSVTAFAADDPVRMVVDLRGVAAGAERTGVKSPIVADVIEEIASAPSLPVPSMPKDLPPPPVIEQPSSTSAPANVRCIVIDPGHGGHDTGTIGPAGVAEKDVVLDIARRLRASLRAELPGVEIVLTRDSDRFVSLEERTAIANSRNADLFISIHANASQSSSASGIETYVPDPNALQAENEKRAKQSNQVYASVSFASQVSQSRALAGYVQGSLVRGVSARSPASAKDRGIKHASFAVLRGAQMPSILAEVSFVSNPDDENRLRTPAFRQRIASSLTSGIRGYVRSLARRG